MPAFLTALAMALIAVKQAFISWVRSPVAWGCFLCSANTNRVSVMQSVSIPPVLVILTCYLLQPSVKSGQNIPNLKTCTSWAGIDKLKVGERKWIFDQSLSSILITWLTHLQSDLDKWLAWRKVAVWPWTNNFGPWSMVWLWPCPFEKKIIICCFLFSLCV